MKHLERGEPSRAAPILDFAYRAYGDRDLLSGYRMLAAKSAPLRHSLLNIQQRKYVQTLSCLHEHAELK
jgi:hypothetical protein